jgi:predicted glycosyltransferase
VNIAVFANTPAQIHFYKNIVKKLEKMGNNIFILIRAEGEGRDLAKELNIPFYPYSLENFKSNSSKFSKMLSMPRDVLRAYKYLKELDIDIVTGFGLYDAYTSFLLGVPSVIFTDDEPKSVSPSFRILFRLYYPFISTLVTPTSFKCDYGKKHVKINSYKEMAYLHPNYYTPNSDIYNILKINKDEPFVLLRFNSLNAFHDFYIKGFDENDKLRLVKDMEKYSHVFVSNEGGSTFKLNDYEIKIPKNRIHDVLYYANLFITDTATMATEAAILGTPTIRCNSLAGENDLGNFIELERKYKLIWNFKNSQMAIEKANELIQIPNLKECWEKRRERLLKEKIDITEYFCQFLVNYSKSDSVPVSSG